MKDFVITVDCGTTNTRAVLWDSQRAIVDAEKNPVGVRSTAIDGHNRKLKAGVKNCIDTLLVRNKIDFEEVKCIIASGMITSNIGLVEIPHLVVPVSADDLAEAVKPVLIEDVCPLPIWFITGVKNADGEVTLANYEAMDIMRGEEVESCAIIDKLHDGKPMLLVLPGSHTKFVSVDAERRMVGCLTSITGELLASITNDTILAGAVEHSFVEEDTYDRELLLQGYDTAKKTGLGRACFSGRILSLFGNKDKHAIANFLLGATLQTDVIAIKNSDAIHADHNTTVVVAGNNPLCRAIADILRHEGGFAEIVEYQQNGDASLSSLGAYIVAGKTNIL